MVKFTVSVTHKGEQLAHVEGLQRPDTLITINDQLKVIPTEQYLERLTGLRFHIQLEEVIEEGPDA